jgi:ferric-dicitrate binding protein FerR (iron transport regulator)
MWSLSSTEIAMKSREQKEGRVSGNSSIDVEAAEWLVRLLDTDVDPEEPIPDVMQRQNAFFDWLAVAPAHVRAFMEVIEVERRVRHPDPQRSIKIQELLEATPANVIQLYDPPYRGRGSQSPTDAERNIVLSGRRKILAGIAAALALLTLASPLYFAVRSRNVYVTGVGEQSTFKLHDGSVIVLNTDTEVQVDFSRQFRNIRLMKGEALFMVEHDAARPFIVSAGTASVRAVGTEFNVRRREQSTEVAVVEGVVQVSSTSETPVTTKNAVSGNSTSAALQDVGATPGALRLGAGEKAQVSSSGMKVSANHDIENVMSWRQRRLNFRETPLEDVAAEFNRYNHTQIRIEGAAAQNMQMTGIFDADHPQAIILYAQKIETLSVEADGDNWIIRSRE